MNTKQKIILLLFITQLFISLSFAQTTVKTVLADPIIEQGSQTHISFIVENWQQQKVQFPKFDKLIAEGIEIIAKDEIDTLDNGKRLAKSFLITAWEDTILTVPSFPIVVGLDTMYTDSLKFGVIRVELDSATYAKIDTTQIFKIFDIKAPEEAPLTFQEFWSRFSWIFWTIFGVITILLLTIYLIHKYKKDPSIIKIQKPKIPAHVMAYKSLDLLDQKQLCQKNRVKQYYSELSSIVRFYIEERFAFPALEQTTPEVLENTKYISEFDSETHKLLADLLKLSDLVKFAKYKPLTNENDLMIKLAYKVVDETKIANKEMQKESENNDEQEEKGVNNDE